MIGVAVFRTRSKMKLFSCGTIQPNGSKSIGMLMFSMAARTEVYKGGYRTLKITPSCETTWHREIIGRS
jgi:hypothetical protein